MLWDVFISHASEDKDSVARPLSSALESIGLRVWFDATQLKLGDSLRAKIDEGLARSRFGVVIVSPAFLAKRWPLREVAGFFARGSDREVVLPVLHNVSSQELAEVSPMLADLVAASTSAGIPAVAARIAEVAAPHLRRPDARGYSSDPPIRLDLLSRALDAVLALAEPSTWPYLSITNPDYPVSGWMGSESDTLIELVYAFAAPLVAIRAASDDIRRNAAMLDGKMRLILALVDAALHLFTNEELIAAAPPPIAYTPRLPEWRSKRIVEPARYWWQGLSPDRFDSLRGLLLQPDATRPGRSIVISAMEFKATYRALYASSCPDASQQQLLGLLCNGFYGFTPSLRPVLWRVIVCHCLLYQAAIAVSLEPAVPGDVNSLFAAHAIERISLIGRDIPRDHLFEDFQITLEACTRYLDTFVLPRAQIAAAVPP